MLKRRSPHTQVYVFPVSVQGDGAADQIAAAIHQADQLAKNGKLPLDVLIVGRGGGSLEDLWAFNEEVVARALFAATVPTVSAVGHEIDFSIADLVADARAATPSAAAELISTDQNELLLHLDSLRDALGRSLQRQFKRLNEQLTSLRKRVRHPGHALSQQGKAGSSLGFVRLEEHITGHSLRILSQGSCFRSPVSRILSEGSFVSGIGSQRSCLRDLVSVMQAQGTRLKESVSRFLS